MDSAPIELVTLRIRASVPRVAADWRGQRQTAAAGDVWRDGFDVQGQAVRSRVLPREAVSAGLAGPAIVTQTDTTTVIPEGWRVARASTGSEWCSNALNPEGAADGGCRILSSESSSGTASRRSCARWPSSSSAAPSRR